MDILSNLKYAEGSRKNKKESEEDKVQVTVAPQQEVIKVRCQSRCKAQRLVRRRTNAIIKKSS